jgi:hypothetical protein
MEVYHITSGFVKGEGRTRQHIVHTRLYYPSSTRT